MPFVSYAQNYEDVILWRALRHVERGFYIDVGAQSPDSDSVTRAFSERGWRGINIEPYPFYAAQLVERRPRDINLSVAVGEHAGMLTMNLVENTGLSTADEDIARSHAAAGYSIQQTEVRVTTLSSIWSEYVPPAQAVHFLKVDVEGFERAVLAGNDWNCNRPWIVVVEAMLPNTQIDSYADWEMILLRASYTFVYADGLNRYYVAQERPELAAAFKYPPNVFDAFVTAAAFEDRERADRAQAELKASHQKVEFAERSLSESRRRIECSEQALIASRQRELVSRERATREANALRHEIAVRDQLVAEANHRAALAAYQLEAVLKSASWRATTPLRKLMACIPQPLWGQARRAAKAAWWGGTPWRIPARIRFIRERDSAAAPLQPPVEEVPEAALDLFSKEAVLAAAGLPRDAELWPEQRPQFIVDKWSAARWCIDLLRFDSDLRSRFPAALSEYGMGGFSLWLAGEGGARLGLSATAKQHVDSVLREGIAARARQYFLFRADVRERLPHGLTPPGQRELFRWFMQHGRQEAGLRSEEVLWLFLEASENPALELVRAYLFTPAWQERWPDGLTMFGRQEFSAWFASKFNVSAEWIDPWSWPVHMSPSRQIRQSYYTRREWQSRHPAALAAAERAEALLDWLSSEQSMCSGTARAWCEALDRSEVAAQIVAGGVNLIAHFCCPSGVRVSAEALAEGMRQLGIETSLRDLRTDISDEPNHIQFDGLEYFDTTIIHTQPEPFFDDAYKRSDLTPRIPRTYRIAYWYWEFNSVPESWMKQAADVDEVWAATEFVAKGLRERLQIPVKTIFPGVQLGSYKRRSRAYFGIDDGKFTLLFNFHMNSMMERKNPLGLIRAFRAAFGPEEPVALVLKTMFGDRHPALMKELRDAAAGCNITIIDRMYTADEVLSLMDACDAYVSLHRSEGLGLTMAEAMLMGKPVIATNYSGNVDFMDDSNSLLVPYELVRVGRPLPPYDADLLWAEPSVEHAAAWMRRLFEKPEWAREVGAKGLASAKSRLSVNAAALNVAKRLAEITAQRRAEVDALA